MSLYRIPDLEWKKHRSATGQVSYVAAAQTGWWAQVWMNDYGWQWLASDIGPSACDSLKDGKAKASAHYRARMARGLVEVPIETLDQEHP